jgi:hypothetical protein
MSDKVEIFVGCAAPIGKAYYNLNNFYNLKLENSIKGFSKCK